jgi:hypothetical protein
MDRVLNRSWLPVTSGDPRSQSILARSLASYLSGTFGILVAIEKIRTEFIFSGVVPAWWPPVAAAIGANPPDMFDFLSTDFDDEDDFLADFGTAAARRVLQLLGLEWATPRAAHLRFGMRPKPVFTGLADDLIRKKVSYDKFFSLVGSLVNKSTATGSTAQLSKVKDEDGITIVSTRLSLGAPELSLLACFPVSALVSWYDTYNCIVTTPVMVSTRRLEFVLLDWKT